MKKSLFISMRVAVFAIVMSVASTAGAYDFQVGDVYFNRTGDATVCVTYGPSAYNTYKGDIFIPSTVENAGVNYTVTSIGDWAFMYCVKLTSVQLPSTLVAIGVNAFNSCTQLESIVLPEGLETISDDAFYFCSKISSITIPNSVKRISDEAFFNCSGLFSVVIGKGVTSIGSDAFGCDGYSSLSSVTCLATTPPVMDASDCFFTTTYNMGTLYVPAASVNAYSTTNWWNKFSSIVGLNISVPGDVNGDGVVNIEDVTQLIDCLLTGIAAAGDADCNGDGKVSIDDVTTLIDMLLNGN